MVRIYHPEPQTEGWRMTPNEKTGASKATPAAVTLAVLLVVLMAAVSAVLFGAMAFVGVWTYRGLSSLVGS